MSWNNDSTRHGLTKHRLKTNAGFTENEPNKRIYIPFSLRGPRPNTSMFTPPSKLPTENEIDDMKEDSGLPDDNKTNEMIRKAYHEYMDHLDNHEIIYEFTLNKLGINYDFRVYNGLSKNSMKMELRKRGDSKWVNVKDFNEKDGNILFYRPIKVKGNNVRGFKVDNDNILNKLTDIKQFEIEYRDRIMSMMEDYDPQDLEWSVSPITWKISVSIKEFKPEYEFRRNIKKLYEIEEIMKEIGPRQLMGIGEKQVDEDVFYKKKDLKVSDLEDSDDYKKVMDRRNKAQEAKMEKRKLTKKFNNVMTKTGKQMIYIHRCWECGSVKIIGGPEGRIPYKEYKLANAQYFDKNYNSDDIRSQLGLSKERGKNPYFDHESKEFVYKIVDTSYCGC